MWLFGKLKSFINSSMGILFAQFLHIMLVILCKQSICHNTYLKKSHRCNLEKLRHFLPGCTQYFLRKKLSIHWIFFHKKIEYVCKSLCEFKARFTKALTFFSKKQFVLAKTLLHFNWSKNRKNNLCLIFSK